MACFPVTFSNCVLGKVVRQEQHLCTGISQEDLAEGNLLCTHCISQLPVHAVLKEVVVPSPVGTDRWQGCPGKAPKPAVPGDHKEEQGTGNSPGVWDRNPVPPYWL